MNKPTILVVEDDSSVRSLITTTLKAHGYKFLTAANGEMAVMMASSHNPDIMLLDLGLPDIDGVEVIRRIREWSNLPIIVLSARSEDSDKIEALDQGADDYLTKPFSVDELLARLRVTQRRLNLQASGEVGSSVFVNGPLKIDFAAGCVWLNDEELHLTPIEYKLLCVLAHNVGKVLTHTAITQKVWGSSQENDIASLRVYMASLRKKLESGAHSLHLVQTHVGVGYRMLRRQIQIKQKQGAPNCWVSVKQFSKNDTATACQDWLRSTRLGRGSIKSHVRTVKVLGMGLFAFQERIHLWKGVTH